MPHLRIEYSTNIAERFDPARLAEAAAATLLASGVFEPPHSIKARLIPVAHFRVGGAQTTASCMQTWPCFPGAIPPPRLPSPAPWWPAWGSNSNPAP
ncbi:hypothetical protein [Zoogloea sp.]|uniref:hypothetical protein n=1 Tax=Zoogloea sp. TaxID=49181 RepID=UPI0035B459A2